jgi:threonine/homoserine/homoserine lactone efflux protein
MSLASFIIAAIIILFTPGPTNTILAASGAALGWRGSTLLPLAEASGYLVAVVAYLMLATSLADIAAAMPLLKGVAALWLMYSAWTLWTQPVRSGAMAPSVAMRHVFFTTILNPKAMLVGAILIPGLADDVQAKAVAVYIVLSLVAGAIWTSGGSLLPRTARPYAYRVAAVVVGIFSVVAASSAIAG